MHRQLRRLIAAALVALSVTTLVATVPLPSKPGNGSTINGHSIATGLVRAFLFNEGTGTITELVGAGSGTATNSPTWSQQYNLGGVCRSTSGGTNPGDDMGANGLSYGNGDATIYWGGTLPTISARQHVAVELAGGSTDGMFAGVNDSGAMQFVLADVIAFDSTTGALTEGDIYTIGVKYDRGVSVRFYGYNQTTADLKSETINDTNVPTASANPSVVGNRRDFSLSWGECLSFLYIWNRVLTDGELDTLNANPYVIITAIGPPKGTLRLLRMGR